ncbi:LPP20 family lipoprotein [Pseudaeromonas sharmana]|uniref:LPP20 family lipoprotein n=1 Tax=Pseudaeromonas sharmana TaxID=328412 RepID=A0ABV8CJ42_9GAMM
MFRRSFMLLCVVGMAACSNNGVTRYQVEEPERFPVLHAVGYAIVDVQPGPSKSEKVLQALRASKLDAYRELTEQVYGQSLQGGTTLRDAVQTSNQLQASVDGMVRGARVVRSYPLDNMYATELELDTRVLFDLYRLQGAL